MAKAILPYVVKKKEELLAVIEYLEGRSSGKEFAEVMNRQVASGKRIGKLRPEGPDFIHGEGLKASRAKGELVRRQRRLTPIPQAIIHQVLHDRLIRRLQFKELSAKYGYTRWILRLIVQDGYQMIPH